MPVSIPVNTVGNMQTMRNGWHDFSECTQLKTV